ncbi:unnamed protein product [Cyprideis torosa]|uniref:Uncharacterized protein n=1 Tax=Cyprideis torosa TaxID=163714 RepID=A0A7R8WLJ6_9CRUS|nr:unnamed protein product [Cyprideis torosa]CAG0904395.1 unnamed protein product [Cyprideis torosa]
MMERNVTQHSLSINHQERPGSGRISWALGFASEEERMETGRSVGFIEQSRFVHPHSGFMAELSSKKAFGVEWSWM